MSTLVCFHAHPDDEAMQTGGLMAKAAAAGHRVVLVTATDGAQGIPQPGVLREGETLAERRAAETVVSAALLGADVPIMLNHGDSGMVGEPSNDDPNCFWQVDVEQAAVQLAAILTEVDADVLTIYDDHGGYGHPDHIQVHRVGLRAAELAGVDHVYEGTMNRDRLRAMLAAALQEAEAGKTGTTGEEEAETPDVDIETFGTPEADISFHIDVTDFVATKRESMVAHRSQIGPDTFFLAMPDEAFAASFGHEWFNRPGTVDVGGPDTVDLLPGL